MVCIFGKLDSYYFKTVFIVVWDTNALGFDFVLLSEIGPGRSRTIFFIYLLEHTFYNV
jgi:hypothetical protein